MNDLTVLIDGSEGPAPADRGVAGVDSDRIDIEWDAAPVKVSHFAQEYLDGRWNAHVADAKASGRMLYDGPITRLISSRWENGRIVLHLGPADYKTFVVTRLRDRAWFQANAPEVRVAALGNSAFLTRGDQAILGIRSAKVSAYAMRAHLLGGVLELLATEKFPATVGGMLKHLREELHEEAGLVEEALSHDGWPRLLGVVQDEFLAQPEAIWQWEVHVPLDVLAQRLAADEHAGSVVVDREGVPEKAWEQMTPCARHAWKIWSGNACGK